MSRRSKAKPGGCLVGTYTALLTPNLRTAGVLVQCKEHPYYRAVRQPRADCVTCRAMYAGQVKDPRP